MSDWTWDLARLNAGELSVLRRAAGVDVDHASKPALRAFYKACGYCDAWQEKFMFPAMCMDALWRSTDEPTVKPMEECLRDFRAKLEEEKKSTESMEHRIDALLETPWEDDGFLIGKLLNLVKILKSKTNLKPDFHRLAEDLNRWNGEKRHVQRKWLKVLYNVKSEKTNEEEETNAV